MEENDDYTVLQKLYPEKNMRTGREDDEDHKAEEQQHQNNGTTQKQASCSSTTSVVENKMVKHDKDTAKVANETESQCDADTRIHYRERSSRSASASASASASSSSSSASTHDNRRCGLDYPELMFRRCGLDYPELMVFDLDACFWNQEKYKMPNIPTQQNVVMGVIGGWDVPLADGVVKLSSGGNTFGLHAGAQRAITENYAGRQHPGMKICFVSSADTPQAAQSRAALQLLEVVPGVTVWDALMQDWNQIDVNQIGRQPPLSSNKARTHFPRIRDMTGIPYHKMLFFDHCNWDDHCGMVAQACTETVVVKDGRGGTQSQKLPVVTHRTSIGLSINEWEKGLDLYRKQAQQYA